MKSSVTFLVGVSVFLGVVAINSVSGVLSGTECPEGWATRLYRCYYFSNKTANWFKAWEECNKLDARLLSLESEAEFQNIQGYIKLHTVGKSHWWTSGSDLHDTSNWAWYGTKNRAYYFNFCSPEDIGDGHCLALSSACGYQIITESCESDDIRYICEKDITL